jgi:hypothetical protein
MQRLGTDHGQAAALKRESVRRTARSVRICQDDGRQSGSEVRCSARVRAVM